MDSSEEKKSIFASLRAVVRHIPGAALMFAIVPLVSLGYFGWYFYGAEHLDNTLYALRTENLQITEQPEWIKSNVLNEVFQTNGLDRLSLLDPNSNATIAQAFETHNWVKSTTRVRKTSGGKVTVDLVYRRPAAMVYYEPPEFARNQNGGTPEQTIEPGFFPIDTDGMILPTENEFSEEDVFQYFIILAAGARPGGEIGMSYGDARIAEALKLCEYLKEDRRPLGLETISVEQESRAVGPSPWVMQIRTKDHHMIRWGHAPGMEANGESPAEEKRQRLIAMLELARKQTSPQRIDLNSPNGVGMAVSTQAPSGTTP